jgi:hypothetical protein
VQSGLGTVLAGGQGLAAEDGRDGRGGHDQELGSILKTNFGPKFADEKLNWPTISL